MKGHVGKNGNSKSCGSGPGLQGERWQFLSPLDALRSDLECTVFRNLEHRAALNDFQRQHGPGHVGASCDCGPHTAAGPESQCSKDDMLHCQGLVLM